MTLLSRRKHAKRCHSRSRRIIKKSLRKKSCRRKRRTGDGGGNDDDPVKFFETLLDSNKTIALNREVTTSTRQFFTEFFTKFRATSVTIDKSQIQKSDNISNYDFLHYIDSRIRSDVSEQIQHTYFYHTYVDRPIKIYISANTKKDENKISKYLQMMVFWLHIVSQYTNKHVCNSETLTIIVILSDLKKAVPSPSCETECTIEKPMVNTGFSDKCRQIVIYRKEEWFKVFVHETFHNYGLDFVTYSNSKVCQQLLEFFKIEENLEVKLFEAYTESWARIINCLLLAYDNEKTNLGRFIELAERNIQLERLNAYFQMCKILHYMNLRFENLKTYTEETSNLSYYFFCAILYSDYQDYIQWSYTNNTPKRILQFDNDYSTDKQTNFANFIMLKSESNSFKTNLKYFKKLFSSASPHNYLYTYMKKSLLTRVV